MADGGGTESDGTPPGGATYSRGTLRVVATPIGNLGDITLRALDVLRSAAVVAAEDTRMTRRLWARYDIATPLLSYHAQSAPGREIELLARLEAGEDVCLVTDAGTPLVSDPGAELVRAWIAAGGRVEPIPGPSAVLAALVASGLPAARWTFEGFLPRKGSDRRERLARIAAEDRTTVFFEAPGRTAATLRELARVCGADRRGALCRELTKLHEEVRRGSLAELADGASDVPPRGEVTLLVAGVTPGQAGPASVPGAATTTGWAAHRSVLVADARARVAAMVADGQPRSSAAKQVARESGLDRRELFAPDREGRS